MTPPQPSSQTLRERLLAFAAQLATYQDTYRLECALIEEAASALAAWDALSTRRTSEWDRRLSKAVQRAETAEAALAAQEASPQPDLAREWFEKGWQAALCNGEWLDPLTMEAAYLAACRQEQP